MASILSEYKRTSLLYKVSRYNVLKFCLFVQGVNTLGCACCVHSGMCMYIRIVIARMIELRLKPGYIIFIYISLVNKLKLHNLLGQWESILKIHYLCCWGNAAAEIVNFPTGREEWPNMELWEIANTVRFWWKLKLYNIRFL